VRQELGEGGGDTRLVKKVEDYVLLMFSPYKLTICFHYVALFLINPALQ